VVVPFADRKEVFAGAARRLIARGLRDGGLDFAEDFTNRLLFEVLCDLAKLSEADKDVLYPLSRMSWAIEAMLPIRDRWRMERTVREGFSLLAERAPGLIARHPESLLAALHRAAPASEPDPLAMAISMFGVFLLMGNDALGGSLGQGVDWLLDPEQHQGATVSQPDWRHVGDDMFRQTATVDYLTRVFTKETTLGGVRLNPGDKVMFSPFAANRDPAKFGPTADRISLAHKQGVGLTFGAGRHLCVGMSMSRHILSTALSVLSEAPPLRLAGRSRHASGTVIRTMESIPVEFA
jgi:cytochrome P450